MWAQGGNRSDSLLGGNEAPESGRIDNGQYVDVFSHRHGKYAGTYAHIPPLVQQVRSRNEISPAQQQLATPSSLPPFYDYSEHFQQSNDTLAPVDQGIGQRQRRVKEEHGRIYESPLRVFSPDEHGLAASIQNQSQGIISSGMTQAGNSALNKDILTADTQEHMRLLPDKGTDFESYNESSDPVSAGDAIAHGEAISGLEDPDAAVSTPQSSQDYAVGDVEVRILRTSIASFVLSPGGRYILQTVLFNTLIISFNAHLKSIC